MRARSLALPLVFSLLAAACGARLTDAQRTAALAGGGGGNVPGGPGPITETTAPGSSPTAPGQTPGVTPSGATTVPGQSPPPAACSSGTRTASDTGVTPTQIKLATIADLSGVQTGLFASAKYGMQAFAAYVNNAGGVCGRQVVVEPRDTGTNSGGNQSATTQSCTDDFAIVGSMSAFDSGGYDAGNQCGIPAIPAVATNAWKSDSIFPPNYYPAYPNRPDHIIDTASYVAQTHPGVKDGAAIIWLNQTVTTANAGAREAAYKQAGFTFVYKQQAQVVDPNYSSYVSQMKSHNPPVKYLTFVGNYQSAENMLQAMDQQSWHPEFIDFDSVVYSPLFLEDMAQAHISTTNLYWFVNTGLFEEASHNPEMQLYTSWLARVDPNQKPDYFGLYAWSAGRLFQQVAESVGPNLTRKAFLGAISKVSSWDDHGMHAAHALSAKLSSPCFLYGKIENYRFVRMAPSSGWTCDHPTRSVPFGAQP